ncbi:MAG: hypothetical protein U1F43_21480 [Myxococcota bacterium]
MKDPLPVNASGADGLLIGITVWFTSQAACERALSATFPTGCSEPR